MLQGVCSKDFQKAFGKAIKSKSLAMHSPNTLGSGVIYLFARFWRWSWEKMQLACNNPTNHIDPILHIISHSCSIQTPRAQCPESCQGSGYSTSDDEAVDGLVDNFARGVSWLRNGSYPDFFSFIQGISQRGVSSSQQDPKTPTKTWNLVLITFHLKPFWKSSQIGPQWNLLICIWAL